MPSASSVERARLLVEQAQHRRARRCRSASSRRARRPGAPAMRSAMRPSCGRRFSAMSSVRHDLDARDHRRVQAAARLDHVAQRAVDAEAHQSARSKVSRWMSEAPSRTACVSSALIRRMIGASFSASRRSAIFGSSCSRRGGRRPRPCPRRSSRRRMARACRRARGSCSNSSALRARPPAAACRPCGAPRRAACGRALPTQPHPSAPAPRRAQQQRPSPWRTGRAAGGPLRVTREFTVRYAGGPWRSSKPCRRQARRRDVGQHGCGAGRLRVPARCGCTRSGRR